MYQNKEAVDAFKEGIVASLDLSRRMSDEEIMEQIDGFLCGKN